ncbi:uncharacterized protein LOC119961707 [Scyliorhinus canicula]|uniref:uncharacterized protein LOC119961707 n=1 Tax=Scyliorhinus canicula TaxID=7830 RepID=UPI0018F400CF|nr:uncharacterized protein LOC119961707 [Scyliorhinus canicula]
MRTKGKVQKGEGSAVVGTGTTALRTRVRILALGDCVWSLQIIPLSAWVSSPCARVLEEDLQTGTSSKLLHHNVTASLDSSGSEHYRPSNIKCLHFRVLEVKEFQSGNSN